MPEPIDWGFALPYYFIVSLAGYLLGSFPTGLVLAKVFGFGDLTSIGSGNIGATNALRTGSKWLAIGTLAGDGAKAALAVFLGSIFGPQTAILAGAFSLLGHLFPLWLKFKGGKGIAVYIGTLATLFYPLALIFIAIWIGVAIIFRYSSLASIIASLAIPVLAYYFEEYQIMDLSLFFLVLILWAHNENVLRLWRGTEDKIGKKNEH